jgi:hypothetical protein
VVGDTAVLTALVVGADTSDGAPARDALRLTQTRVRTPDGWRCLSGQADRGSASTRLRRGAAPEPRTAAGATVR